MTIRKLRGEIVALPLASYDGIAKPGEIVVDEATFFTYIANGTGQLSPIGSGGGGGGSTTSIVNGTSNVTIPFAGGNVTVGVGGASNVMDIGPTQITLNSNIVPNGDAVYSLGAPGAQFKDLYLSNTTLYLNLVPITVTSNANLQVGGLNVLTDDGTGNIPLTGNLALVGNVVANSITSNSDIYGANAYLSQTVTANLGVNADIITGRTGALSIRAFGLDQNITMVPTGNGALDISNKRITSLANPIDSSDGATKIYVDGVASGLRIRPPVAVATTTNLVGTYINGASGVGATFTLAVPLVFMDGYTMQIGDRVLIKDQTNAIENGIYVRTSSSVFTRATDSDIASELTSAYVFVQNGSVNAKSGFVQTAPIATVGTNNIVFTQFSDAGDYTAGVGLSLTGSTFSIANTGVVSGIYGTANIIPSLNINSRGQIVSVSNITVDRNAANLTGTTLSTTVVNSSLTSLGTLTGLSVNGVSNLGPVANVKIMGGTNNQVLVTAGGGVLSWANVPTPESIGNGASNVAIPIFSGNVVLTSGGSIGANVTPTGLWAPNVNVAANVTTLNLTVGAISNLGGNGNVKISGGVAGQVLSTNGAGDLTWVSPASAGSAISNGASNVDIATSGGSVTVGVGGTAGVLTITSTGANVVGTANISGTANLGGALNVGGVSNLGPVGNVVITGGVSGQVLSTDGAGVLSWVTVSGGGALANGTSSVTIPVVNSAVIITSNGLPVASFESLSGARTIQMIGNATFKTGSVYFGEAVVGGGIAVADFTNTSNVTLGPVANVRITGGTNGQVLSTDGTGVLSWVTISGGGGNSIANGTSSVTIPVVNSAVIITSNGLPVASFQSLSGARTIQMIGNTTFKTGSVYFGESGVGSDLAVADFTNTSNVTLGPVGNVRITGGTNGQVLTTNGSGGLSWTTVSGGGALANGTSSVTIPTVNGSVLLTSNNDLVAEFYSTSGDRYADLYGNITATGYNSSAIKLGLNGNEYSLLDLQYVANINIPDVTKLRIAGGTSGQVLTTDGSSGLSWTTVGSGSLANGTSSVTIPVVDDAVYVQSNGNLIALFGDNDTRIFANTRFLSGNILFGESGTEMGLLDFQYTGNVNLGALSNIHIDGGTNGQVLTTDGSGVLNWTTISSGTSSIIANGNSNVTIPTAAGGVEIYSNGVAIAGFVSTGGVKYSVLYGNTSFYSGNVAFGGSGVGQSLSIADFTNTSNVTLGPVGNVRITGGTNGQVLTTDGSGGLSWTSAGGSGSIIANGTSNVTIPSTNGTVSINVNGSKKFDITATALVSNSTDIIPSSNLTGNVGTSSSRWANIWTGNAFVGSDLRVFNDLQISGNISAYSTPGTKNIGNATDYFGSAYLTDVYTDNLRARTSGDIIVTGNLIPSANVSYNLGSLSMKWNAAYFASTTIYLGDTPVSISANNTLTVGNAEVVTQNPNGETQIQGNIVAPGEIQANGNISTSGNLITTGNLQVSGISDLGGVANIRITGGTNGQVLTTNGSGNLSWTTVSGGGGGGNSISADSGNVAVSVAKDGFGNFWANTTFYDPYTSETRTLISAFGANDSANSKYDPVILFGSVQFTPPGPPVFKTVSVNVFGNLSASSGTVNLSGNSVSLFSSNLNIQNSKWPSGYGNNGQVLTTDGTGNLSWANAGGGGGSSTFINNGNSYVWIPSSDGAATIIIYNDTNNGSYSWNFNRNGNLQLPIVANAQMTVSGTTRTVAADPHPANGTGSVVVWTATNSTVCGAKMTLRAKNVDGNVQMMEIMMAKDINSINVNWTIANRVKSDSSATDIPITVSLSSSRLRVTATVVADHAFTYTVDEFAIL